MRTSQVNLSTSSHAEESAKCGGTSQAPSGRLLAVLAQFIELDFLDPQGSVQSDFSEIA
ncbi:MAG: hypothetical protein ACRDJL_13110 [Actinomycetota bacterium]